MKQNMESVYRCQDCLELKPYFERVTLLEKDAVTKVQYLYSVYSCEKCAK